MAYVSALLNDGLRTYKGYTFNFEAIAQQLYRVTQPGGVGVWVVADETKNGSESGTSFRQALYFMSLGFNLHDTMIYEWHKPPLTHNRYEQSFEYMFVFSKGTPKTFNPITEPTEHAGEKMTRKGRAASFSQGAAMRQSQGGREPTVCKSEKIKSNIWFYKAGRILPESERYVYEHPAVFPEALARDHILSWSNPGDLVLDPMAGSGTVAKMAYLTGRKSLGFEISQEYTDLARRRLQAAMSQPALFNPYQPAAKVEPVQLELGA